MLTVDNLTVAYGERVALRQVSFELQTGQILAVIGPNGAGKSTLIRALSGVIPLQSGTINWDKQDLDALPEHERARLVAVVPQARSLPGAATGWQTVLLGRTPYLDWLGHVSDKDERLVREAMERTSTLDLAERAIGELSGGEQQRLLLARALAQSTPLLLLDEPTTHLDLHYQISLLNLVQSLVHSDPQPLGALVVLHDLNLVARYADQVLLRVGGQVRASGSVDAVLSPDILSEAYQIPLEVLRRPGGGWPVILPTYQ